MSKLWLTSEQPKLQREVCWQFIANIITWMRMEHIKRSSSDTDEQDHPKGNWWQLNSQHDEKIK